MPSPTTVEEFLDLVRKSGVVEDKRLAAFLDKAREGAALPAEPAKLAGLLVHDGVLTNFQAEQFLLGKWRRFTIGKYKVLERLGSGGMGSVYLCEHKLMRRRVAVKVLPTAKAEDPSSLERFYREARAVAALDHPNIVRAYDIDQDDKLHFLVMEHVDGASLQEIIKKTGPMDVLRATHYVRQAALGLQHAHEAAGLVHRDIKPGNVLVDRNGIVKILDMGLARFFHDEEDILTKKYDENVLGTADYLAPEQALDSHSVDIRADVYSLGATFYYCLTGRTPFADGTVAQKLIWHQTRQPKAIRSIRPEVPEGIAAVIEKMMAKDAGQRYQTPLEVALALDPWTRTPIPPPPESEMPQLSPAAMGFPSSEPSQAPSPRSSAGPPSPAPRKGWQVPSTPAPQPAAKPTPPPRPSAPPPNQAKSLRNGAVTPTAKPVAGPASAPPKAVPRPSGVRAAAAPAVPSLTGPKPAGNGQKPPSSKNALTLDPPAEEERAPWEELAAADSDKALASLDTNPTPARKSAVTSAVQPRVTSLFANRDRRFWIIFAGTVAAVFILLGILLLAWALSSGAPTEQPSTRRPPLVVNPAGGLSLSKALEQAHSGDRIVVESDIVDALPPITYKDLTIEAAPGKMIHWKFPPNPPAGAKKLLSLHDAEGFRLKGFRLDGDNRAELLVQISGRCPGLVLENLSLTKFQKRGIVVFNCEGTADRRMTFANLHFITKEGQTALFFNINDRLLDRPRTNSFLTIRDCDFDGPGAAVKAPNLDFIGKTVQLPAGVAPIKGE